MSWRRNTSSSSGAVAGPTAAAAAATPDRPEIPKAVWRIAYVVVLGGIMGILDTTIVNVALRSLATDLDTSLAQIQWVATGYLLALAATIPISGWLARRVGAKRLYLASLLLFIAGSALCALAWSSESLIGFRILQGLGGGLTLPVGQMIMFKAAGPRNIGRLMAAMGVAMVLAPVFGPTLGGLLIEHAGWQWIFLINVPIGIVALTLAQRLLPPDTADDPGRFDTLGFVLVVGGVVGVTYGLAESGQTGSFASVAVFVPLVVGIVALVAFVLHALRVPRAILDVRLWANPAFAAAGLTTFVLGAALFGGMLLMPLYFQIVRGEDVVTTGLLLIPQGIGAAIAMRLSARAVERFGGGLTAMGGCIITLVATIPFALIGSGTSYWLIGAAMVVRGFGIGMSMMPSWTAAFSVLGPHQINDATPQLTVLQRVGGSIGTALLTVLLQNHLDAARSPAAEASAFGSTYWWVMGMALAAVIPCFVLWQIERRTGADEHAALAQAELATEAAAV
jgi:EmrB/QacA subfamily drug resistance transporter